MSSTKLSTIILTWNSEQYISNCLNSLLQSLGNRGVKIILIDNGSTDKTTEIISEFADGRFFTISNKQNLGVSKARNMGLRNSVGEYILFLDMDTVVNKEALDEMIHFMDSNPECGICSCMLKNSEGMIQNSCRKIPSFRYKMLNVLEAIFLHIHRRKLSEYVSHINSNQFYREKFGLKQAFEVEYLIGACQLIRRSAFEQVGFLDEKIFYGPEDADFCIRLKEKKWKIFYLPYVSIIHEYQQISRKRIFSKISYIHFKALIYFFWKHKIRN